MRIYPHRAHLAEKSIASRAFYRTILMKGFHFLVTILCTKNIEDTQCGFKLFTNQAAKILFRNLHLRRWAFDIELIYQAEALGIQMKEVSDCKIDDCYCLNCLFVLFNLVTDFSQLARS